MFIHTPSTITAPTIETERLILRAHTADDFDTVCAIWNHPMIVDSITLRTSTRQEIWFRILRYAGLWPLLGYGYWAVEERASGRFLGDVGFADFKRSIEPPTDGIPEAGWVIDPNIQGKGYATEAILAALTWLDHHRPELTSTCIISPDNLPSLRVADKCGYKELTRTVLNGNPIIQFLRKAAHPAE